MFKLSLKSLSFASSNKKKDFFFTLRLATVQSMFLINKLGRGLATLSLLMAASMQTVNVSHHCSFYMGAT